MINIENIKRIYKPYRYTKLGKITLLETSNQDYILKKSGTSLNNIYSYLDIRGFNNHPRIIEYTSDGYTLYEYIPSQNIPIDQKSIDLCELLAKLHHKTTFFKTYSEDKFKTIYDNIQSNIGYLYSYYSKFYDNFFKEVFHSPSHYMFLNNYYRIISMLSFCEKELESWYEIVKHKTSQRVVLVHNNVSLSHYLKNNQNEYLISWEKAKIDTPVLDLVSFYNHNFKDISFKDCFNKYIELYTWHDDEIKLFYILIALPIKIEFNKDNELNNCKEINKLITYLRYSEQLIRPYYSENKEKQ